MQRRAKNFHNNDENPSESELLQRRYIAHHLYTSVLHFGRDLFDFFFLAGGALGAGRFDCDALTDVSFCFLEKEKEDEFASEYGSCNTAQRFPYGVRLVLKFIGTSLIRIA